MKIAYVVFVVTALAISSVAHASGFGWYVTSVPWTEFDKEMRGIEEEAGGVIKSAPQSAPLKKYLQTQLNNSVFEACQSKKPLYRDVSPLWQEFYPVDTLKYARERQFAAGKKATWFNQFFSQPVHFPKLFTQNSELAEPYFLVPAKMVSEFYEEVRELN